MLDLDGHEVRLSNPDKVFFENGLTKLDLLNYYLAVAESCLLHLRDRPTTMKRYPNGAGSEFFFQKRVPPHAPDWIESTRISFPSGRHADLLVCQDRAHLAFGVNLGVIDWNPWPVRAHSPDHPDELRLDLDPTPEASFDDVRRVCGCVGEVLDENGLRGFPKTSGSRGMHVLVRIHPQWSFYYVRRAALALAREVERRMPGLATSAWWKEQRKGVFVDYNQNARDRTVASAYSVRPSRDGLVSTPLLWEEVEDCEPAELRTDTVVERLRSVGDPSASLDQCSGSLADLLSLADRDEADGLQDAPWPVHFAKQPGEPRRVSPSRRRRS
jgi:bifunctional non-homologous end joining protein LigD